MIKNSHATHPVWKYFRDVTGEDRRKADFMPPPMDGNKSRKREVVCILCEQGGTYYRVLKVPGNCTYHIKMKHQETYKEEFYPALINYLRSKNMDPDSPGVSKFYETLANKMKEPKLLDEKQRGNVGVAKKEPPYEESPTMVPPPVTSNFSSVVTPGVEGGVVTPVVAIPKVKKVRKPRTVPMRRRGNFGSGMIMFPCCECDRSFVSLHQLQSHISITHLGYLPYRCHYCSGYHSASEEEMQEHVKKSHMKQWKKGVVMVVKRFDELRDIRLSELVNACFEKMLSTQKATLTVTAQKDLETLLQQQIGESQNSHDLPFGYSIPLNPGSGITEEWIPGMMQEDMSSGMMHADDDCVNDDDDDMGTSGGSGGLGGQIQVNCSIVKEEPLLNFDNFVTMNNHNNKSSDDSSIDVTE